MTALVKRISLVKRTSVIVSVYPYLCSTVVTHEADQLVPFAVQPGTSTFAQEGKMLGMDNEPSQTFTDMSNYTVHDLPPPPTTTYVANKPSAFSLLLDNPETWAAAADGVYRNGHKSNQQAVKLPGQRGGSSKYRYITILSFVLHQCLLLAFILFALRFVAQGRELVQNRPKVGRSD